MASFLEIGGSVLVLTTIWLLCGVTHSVYFDNFNHKDNSFERKILSTIWSIVVLIAFTGFICWYQGINPFISSGSTNKSVRES